MYVKDSTESSLHQGRREEGSANWIVTVSNVSIVNSRNRVLLNLTPNSFPAARYSARRDAGDDSPIEYIQVCPSWGRCESLFWIRKKW